jgi:hypothetical protein
VPSWGVLLFFLFAFVTLSTAMPLKAIADEYSEKIKPIFESRCIACHSCYNAPCQLNLQSYSGAARGATTLNVYDATRLKSVPPTRVDIDATAPSGWRAKGFHDVLGAGDPQASLLLRLTRLRQSHPSLQPKKQAAESQLCVLKPDDGRIANEANTPELAMPYGLPPLSEDAIGALQAWIAHGAPAPVAAGRPEREAISAKLGGEVQDWEQFLNASDPRQQLVSRYLYEHLFLAHLYFADDAPNQTTLADAEQPHPQFFRLVRSRTACDAGIDEIATRRPSDPSGTASMFYCLRPVTAAVVNKTHIPFELSPGKLERIKSLFLAGDWKVIPPPSNETHNPFATFAAIPIRARYQFLLDNAHFYVATFIKGPVCNGSAAVNSIQDQFYVFFLKPDADSMVMLPDFAAAAVDKLILPGAWGSDIDLPQELPSLTHIFAYREEYRTLRAQSVRKLRPNGYSLDDIWDGDGSNPNALLTVFRHDDNAAVFNGAIGDLPKTIFVLDYPLFERLVYDLVVDFDVFGNVGHQVLTRVYMDLIRMEAEELFLSFLPPADRQTLRKDWYKGDLFTDIKVNIIFPLTNQNLPTAITFRSKDHKLEFVERALFERLSATVRGPDDPINWRKIQPTEPPSAQPSPAERALRRIASIPARDATPFSRYFPEFAVVLVKRDDGSTHAYSIVHNREHQNVSWIMGEASRLAPMEDTLTIKEGVLGAYPNMLFVVDEPQLEAFSNMAAGITSSGDYKRLVDRFGVKRTSADFWEAYDRVNAIGRQMRIDGGALDLTRYELDPR